MELVHVCGLILVLFSGGVHSWGSNSYRGGSISYKPHSFYTNTVQFNYRLAFDSWYVYCGSPGYSVKWTDISSSPWTVTRFSYRSGVYFKTISSSDQILCRSFSREEGWSEGYNSFIFQTRNDGISLIALTYGQAYWIRNVTGSGYGSMILTATTNTSVNGVFNNSSPVSTLPLTVYVTQGIPSVIKIPFEDPDGDIVRCRNARYQECYRGRCTNFPHGVLDEGSCTLRYNGAGSAGQLFPIILKLEDFPSGTTLFDSSNSLGSVDLQFVVHIKKNNVRIQGGGSSGLLQVFHNGTWGTVCHEGWSMTNADVVCRQLGFGGALSHAIRGGSGQIWLDDVQCSGNESAIQQCRHNGWGIHDCVHSEDVFVACYRDACSDYAVLDAADRAQGYRGIKTKCDNRITRKWYRFVGDAGTAMATSCVPLRHCGTSAPGWMQGSHPTHAEGIVTRTACFHWNNTCCSRSISIRVKNCGGFYTYLLDRTLKCSLRYCGNNTESNNTCVDDPCRNGATCINTDYGYKCSCPYGYTGANCETGARATNCWHTAVSIYYTVGPSTFAANESDANSIMNEVLNQGAILLSCSGLVLKLFSVTITTTSSNYYVITGNFGVLYGELNSTQKQAALSCLWNAVIFDALVLRPDYYTSPLKGTYFADRAYLTKYQDRTCCKNGLITSSGICDLYPCYSNPCRNGGTCNNGYYGRYYCSCTSEYTGQQCETALNDSCPCVNGGLCRYNGCECPNGYTGKICETNLQTNVTCGENYMQIDLKDSYFTDIDWRNLHLKDPSCRATKTPDTRRLRTHLDRCDTTYTEDQKTITFWNEVKTDNRYQPVGNRSVISRDKNLLVRFFCAYERSRFVSTSFSPSKKTVVASEGSYGNFTFTMDLYQTSRYQTPYSPFAYPVVVYPNQPLWVQYAVKNTNADLIVFAENCHATPSNDPNATPQHVFLQRGCVRDPTMVYWHNPYSNVQRFSIRSFRFVYSNTFLVYLHCELLVCHRNTTNSRCAQGCISGSRRRRETADMDGSKAYDLSAGPLKGGRIENKNENQEGSLKSKQLIGGLGAVGGVFFVIIILLSVIVYRNRKRVQDNKPASIALDVTVNSYEQDNVDSDEKDNIEL